MSMLAGPEDAASLLEQFIHDVANTPAEITHLLEEIQAKDMQIQAFRDEISKRDAQLQKWVRVNGGHVQNPKEDAFSETVKTCYDKCEILQAEKCGLSEKALIVLDRQVRRLDVGLRSLQAREEFPADWGGPSLLAGAHPGPNSSTGAVGVGITNGPLQVVSGNIGSTGGAPNVANAAQIRMAQAAAGSRSGGATATPPSTSRNSRESSSEASKRRRLNSTLGTLPTAGSSLRQTSLGPGTPKAGTPVPSVQGGSRAGSAQPSQKGGVQKKAPTATQPNRKVAPHQAVANKNAKRARNATKKSDRKRQITRDRATPSTNASLSEDEDESASPTPSTLPAANGSATDRTSRRTNTTNTTTASSTTNNNTADEDEDEENDDQLYCYCQKVSFGDMVGCDNDNCEYQWFHWDCVGLKSEPEGEWLCPTCRKLPKGQVVISRA